MTIHFEQETEDQFSFDPQEIANIVIDAALEECKCPYEADVNLLLVGADTIQEMNRNFREIDRVTDVLSFPMLSYQEPADFSDEALDLQDAFHPESGELMLGDIVICVPRMKEQAEEYGHGEKREFAFLVVHSMLHLFGYDHMTADEAKEMESLQENILNKCNITR
jgi:probable rRNA maturation factor